MDTLSLVPHVYTIDVYACSYHVSSSKHKFIPVPLHLLFQDQSAKILC